MTNVWVQWAFSEGASQIIFSCGPALDFVRSSKDSQQAMRSDCHAILNDMFLRMHKCLGFFKCSFTVEQSTCSTRLMCMLHCKCLPMWHQQINHLQFIVTIFGSISHSISVQALDLSGASLFLMCQTSFPHFSVDVTKKSVLQNASLDPTNFQNVQRKGAVTDLCCELLEVWAISSWCCFETLVFIMACLLCGGGRFKKLDPQST